MSLTKDQRYGDHESDVSGTPGKFYHETDFSDYPTGGQYLWDRAGIFFTEEQKRILIEMRIPEVWDCRTQVTNKEYKMVRINVNSLLKLADKSYAEEVASHGGSLPTLLQEALQEQLKAREKDAANQAASEIIALLGNAEQAVETQVKSIRRSRELIAQSKAQLEKIARAKAYGLETSNFLPLVHALGLSYHTQENFDAKLLEVPADWKDPKAQTDEAKPE